MVQVQSSSLLLVNGTFLSAGQHFTPKAALLPLTRQSRADPDSQPPLIYQSGSHLIFCPELTFFHSHPCCKKCNSKKFHCEKFQNFRNFQFLLTKRSEIILTWSVTFGKFSWSRSREKSSQISITVFIKIRSLLWVTRKSPSPN